MTKLTETDFENLFNVVPGNYIVLAANDPDFTILAQNDGHATATNTDTSKKPIGQPVLTPYPDTSEDYVKNGNSALLNSFRKVIKTGEPDEMPVLRYDIADSDGNLNEYYWRLTHYPIFDGKKVTAVLQSNEEITEEMLAAKELDRTSMQLDNALSVANIGTWQWNVQTDHVTADKHLAKMFGVSADISEKGLPIDIFINSIYIDDRERVLSAIQKTVETCGVYEQEYRTISTTGAVRWVIARGQVEPDEDGKALNFPGVIIDISETKQASINATFFAKISRELVGSTNRKKVLHTIAGMIVPDIADWCAIDLVNDSGKIEQIAVAHKDPEKVAWAKAYHREHQKTLDTSEDISTQVIHTGKPVYIPKITTDYIRKNAKSKSERDLAEELDIASLIIAPLVINNEIIGTISLILTSPERYYSEADFEFAQEVALRISLAITNISLLDQANLELQKREQLQAQLTIANQELEQRVVERTEQLQKLNGDLQRTNQELQDFAYVASHDLQEPLRKIQAFGNLLEDEYGDKLGEGSDYLKRMRNAAARMSTLIEDLLEFSRVTTHAKGFSDVDLNEILVGVLEDLETRIQETGGSVQSPKLPVIHADAMQMRQLFQNLIGNALKFHKPDGRPEVTIQAKSSKDTLTLTFSDNGVGFDEKYVDKIFAVFQRLHSRENYKGTGIGLAVCRKIVERHGGTISARSKTGHGATFTVTLATK